MGHYIVIVNLPQSLQWLLVIIDFLWIQDVRIDKEGKEAMMCVRDTRAYRMGVKLSLKGTILSGQQIGRWSEAVGKEAGRYCIGGGLSINALPKSTTADVTASNMKPFARREAGRQGEA